MEIGEGENGAVTLTVRRPSESLALRPNCVRFSGVYPDRYLPQRGADAHRRFLHQVHRTRRPFMETLGQSKDVLPRSQRARHTAGTKVSAVMLALVLAVITTIAIGHRHTRNEQSDDLHSHACALCSLPCIFVVASGILLLNQPNILLWRVFVADSQSRALLAIAKSSSRSPPVPSD